MNARPVVLSADERTVVESLAHEWMLGRVLLDPKDGLTGIRTSCPGGGDPFTSVDWAEGRAIVRRWFEPTPREFWITCRDTERGLELSDYHRTCLHVAGHCVKSWDIGEPVRIARITWRRLEAWATALPLAIRERARTEWRKPAMLIGDALAVEYLQERPAELVGQGVLW